MGRWWRGLEPQGRTAMRLLVLLAVMASLTVAAVPFYSWFCRVTGYGGETNVAAANDNGVLDQTIKVRFDANVDRGFPWEFKPETREMTLRIGETGIAFYKATNISKRPIAGQASYNVAPFSAGYFFTKIDCFCFTYQVLQPGETKMMPVTFYVDPSIVTDDEGKYVHTITLSYTFHETDLQEADAPAEATDASGALPPKTQDVN